MTPQDTTQFAKCLHVVATVYNKSLSRDLIELYWQVLSQYTIDNIKHALQQHIRDPQRGRFFPTPADIEHALHSEHTQRAQRAWQCLVKAIYQVGLYGSISFDDKLILLVVRDLGGWMKLCTSQEVHLSRYAQTFCDKYLAYLQHPTSITQHTHHCITGLIDNHNGTAQQPTTLITLSTVQTHCAYPIEGQTV